MPNVLKHAKLVRREVFDPKNVEHIESLKVFLRTGNWGEVQFYPELPFIETPITVLTKYAESVLGVTRESAMERETRMNAMNLIPLDPPMTGEARRHKAHKQLETANHLLASQIQQIRHTIQNEQHLA